MTATTSLGLLANELGLQKPEISSVKPEPMSSPPPLIEDLSGILEDGKLVEQRKDADSLPKGLHFPDQEHSLLKDRHKQLERQHHELQDLASAYSEVIRGFSNTNNQPVTIAQLQAEAGRDGLRAKALEADVLRPLISEAGGLQALISQTHTMRAIVCKTGGLRELEQFVSDLRTIRDTLDEIGGSRGLSGLATEVRCILMSQQQHDDLKAQVDGPHGLRAKAAKFDKLMQVFVDVQTNDSYRKHNATTSAIHTAQNICNTPRPSNVQPGVSSQPPAAPAIMNPARARLISTTPLEADPDRDLYEASSPVPAPRNRTGSNNMPLGPARTKHVVQPPEPHSNVSTSKRKGTEIITPDVPAKRPRVDLGRVSALVQASLTAATSGSATRASGRPNVTNTSVVPAGFAGRVQFDRSDSEGAVLVKEPEPQVKTSVTSLKLPDWMRTDVQFGSVGFTPAPGSGTFTSSTLPSQGTDLDANVRAAPVPFVTNNLMPSPFLPGLTSESGDLDRATTQVGTLQASWQYPQLSVLRTLFKHPIALWVGSSDGSPTSAWDAYQSYGLKRDAQVPDELLRFLLGELAKYVVDGNIKTYEQMVPNRTTCILR
ncbi:hypothetical protein N0V94_002047 [Neodidymelliopsis sp. IMI 364377]|nr:hypothetical protein N0V94_002047 [Neodidymelliopsis sp. IMI 364377]